MNNSERDPGLQPERTSMSWMRTHFLSLGIGALMIRIGGSNDSLVVQLNGGVLLLATLFAIYYSRRRFKQTLDLNHAVKNKDIDTKRILAFTIALCALTCAVESIVRYWALLTL
ncbi:DUF202 domain-containing protein [Vibrio sp. TH_r3]|uniref:DUF202 domain-containing protein n=1 Tax=Vibrio sp. TH_r3 TaxID=3082084 RepID=UPI0029542BF8|nr:DUF202 domain-containing protein [Vibrio sp. TH_r3]MDV7103723.1 DUF202 domain-containing protein [Vibrio sp. TH_r3]